MKPIMAANLRLGLAIIAAAAVAGAFAAFFWGHYLLGPTYGTVCAAIT